MYYQDITAYVAMGARDAAATESTSQEKYTMLVAFLVAIPRLSSIGWKYSRNVLSSISSGTRIIERSGWQDAEKEGTIFMPTAPPRDVIYPGHKNREMQNSTVRNEKKKLHAMTIILTC
jgi:formylmethanofuran dehydrogenase subunit D